MLTTDGEEMPAIEMVKIVSELNEPTSSNSLPTGMGPAIEPYGVEIFMAARPDGSDPVTLALEPWSLHAAPTQLVPVYLKTSLVTLVLPLELRRARRSSPQTVHSAPVRNGKSPAADWCDVATAHSAGRVPSTGPAGQLLEPAPSTVSGPNTSPARRVTEHEVWKEMAPTPAKESVVSAPNGPSMVKMSPSEMAALKAVPLELDRRLRLPDLLDELDPLPPVESTTSAGNVANRSPYDFDPCRLRLRPCPASYLKVIELGRTLFSLSQTVQNCGGGVVDGRVVVEVRGHWTFFQQFFSTSLTQIPPQPWAS
jgi:hypothetical protein